MAQGRIGVDIGENQVKMALCMPGEVRRLAVEPLPDGMVRGGRILSYPEMGRFLRQMRHKYHFQEKQAALILPAHLVFSRRMTMPLMTVEQLELNLPYEFRDYITQEKDKYFYDYAVISFLPDENKNDAGMDVMAAAVLKSTIAEYEDMFRQAGMKLKVAAPVEFAYRNLLRALPEQHSGQDKRDYCLLDLGHTATRVHIFSGSDFEVAREIEEGNLAMLDSAIAEEMHVDLHVARNYKQENYQLAQKLAACRGIYSRIALDIMKAVNYYGFNNPNSNLQDIYYGGGGAAIEELVETIHSTVGLRMSPMAQLLPPIRDNADLAPFCGAAIGITQQ